MRDIALKKAAELAEKLAEEQGLELVSYRSYKDEEGTEFLEILVDHDYRITIEEIEAYSQVLSDRLDTIEELDGPYMLDVASPGVDRDVPKADLPKLLGRYLEITAENLKVGDRVEGTLESIENDVVALKRFIKGAKKVYRIPISDILNVRLTVKS